MPLSTETHGFIIDPLFSFMDDKGKTIKNGFVRVFFAGSSTPAVTYLNWNGAMNQETIQLDNSGRVATAVIGPKDRLYKVCVYDQHHSQETPILTVDNVQVLGTVMAILDGSVTTTKLAPEAVTAEKLHESAVTTPKLADGSVTEEKLSDELKIKVIKDYVTPEMFGAVGDGVTDDYVALQKAINYATSNGVLLKIVNKYICGSILLIDVNNHVKIEGVSTKKSWITFTDGAYLKITGARIFEIKISHLELNASDTSPYAMYANRLDQAYFNDVYFNGGTDSSVYLVGYFTWFENCYFMTAPCGIKMKGDLNVFYNCNIWNHSTAAIYLIGAADETIFENTVFEGYAKLVDADLTADFNNTNTTIMLRGCHCLGAITPETGIPRSYICDIVQSSSNYFMMSLVIDGCRIFTMNEDSDYVIQLSTHDQSYISIINSFLRPNAAASCIIKTNSNSKSNLKLFAPNRLDQLGISLCNDYSKIMMIGSEQTSSYYTKFNDGLVVGEGMPPVNSNPGFMNYDNVKNLLKLFIDSSNTYRYLQPIQSGPTSSRPSGAVQGQIYYDYTIRKLITFRGDGWLVNMPLLADSSSNRPTTPSQGQIFFDTTLGKLIVWKGDSWVNADGTPLS